MRFSHDIDAWIGAGQRAAHTTPTDVTSHTIGNDKSACRLTSAFSGGVMSYPALPYHRPLQPVVMRFHDAQLASKEARRFVLSNESTRHVCGFPGRVVSVNTPFVYSATARAQNR